MPLPGGSDISTQAALDDLARALVVSADQVATLIRSAVRNAGGRGFEAVEQFWIATESRFFSTLIAASMRQPDGPDTDRPDWLAYLRGVALALFDEAAPLAADTGAKAARIVKARQFLGISLAGYGAGGTKLRAALGLPAVEPKRTTKRKPR
jgi:CRISPR system Cascade subunit CasA